MIFSSLFRGCVTHARSTIFCGLLLLASASRLSASADIYSVYTGTSISFAVSSDGSPAPTFQWRKDGVAIAGATAAMLTFNAVTTADAGTYTVVATNVAGSAISNDAVLVVSDPLGPVITTQPAGQTVTAGTNVTFSTTVSGTPAPTYQWKKNGAAISGATNATLSLNSVSTGDAGTYTLVATNAGGTATSDPAVLVVNGGTSGNAAPVFTTQPTGQTVFAGTNVAFTVTASGNPTPTFQWRKNGAIIAGATDAVLILPSTTTADAGTYTAVAANGVGSVVSADAVLIVNPAPTGVAPAITTQPVSVTATTGGTATFTVVASGTPAPTFQWQKNGTPITGWTDPTLVLTGVTSNDIGAYAVVVTNYFGSVTSNVAALNVVPPVPANVAPTFTVQPAASQSVTVGTNVTFTVNAAGNPTPTYQWQKNGNAISGATSDTLTLNAVSTTDAATYTAVATNAAGSVVSTNSVLTVNTLPVSINVAPAITTQPIAIQAVTAGGSFTLFASASGTPAPTFQWKKNGLAITGATAASLTINSVIATDAATYTVVATNVAGSATSNDALIIVNSPPITVPLPPSGVNAAPVFTSQPAAQQTITPGANVTIIVTASGSPAPAFQWKKNGFSIAGATGAALTLYNVTQANDAVYTVVASNSLGSVTSNRAVITVANPSFAPTITVQPAGQSVVLGSSVTFNVTATGTPAPSFQWRREGIAIAGATNASLTVANVQTGNAGRYDVVVSNIAGTVTSSVANLVITRSSTALTNPPPTSPTPPNQPAITSRLSNLSVRAVAGTGAKTLIVGFVVSGGSNKSLLVRGIGPTLSGFGVAGSLADPVLSLYSGTALVASNDGWSGATNAPQIATISANVGAFNLSTASHDAAILTTLSSGAFTAQISDKNSATGVALLEVYDAAGTSDARLVNLSVRAEVGTGANVPIIGFVIDGTSPKQLLIRAVGPALGAFGVDGVLADPKLELYQGSTLLNQNDNWGGDATLRATFNQVGAFAISDSNSKDAALLVTLQPGAYSAIISGVNNSTGVAIVEVYEVP